MNKIKSTRIFDFLIHIFFSCFVITISWDTVFSIEISIFTLKISYLFIFLSSVIYFIVKLYNKSKLIIFPKNWSFLYLLYFILFLSIFESNFTLKSIGYFLWAIFTIIFIYVFIINYLSTKEKLFDTLKLLYYSSIVTSVIIIIQFILNSSSVNSILGYPTIINGKPNGLSYEASYSACYLIIIQCIMVFLIISNASYSSSKNTLLNNLILYIIFAVNSIAIILLESRSGWISLGIVFIVIIINLIKKIKLKYILLLSLTVTFILGSIFIILPDEKKENFTNSFLKPLNVFYSNNENPKENIVDYSTKIRLESFKNGLEIFKESPIIGIGLGNYGKVLSDKYYHYNNQNDIHSLIPTSLWFEILIELGIVGLFVFLLYIIFQLKILIKIKKSSVDVDLYIISKGLMLSIIILLFISFFFIPTLFKPYYWFLFALPIILHNLNNNYYRYNFHPKRITLFKIGAIGDLLTLTPSIRAIKKMYPKSIISLIVGKSNLEVVKNNTYLDKIICIDDNKLFRGSLISKIALCIDIIIKIYRLNSDTIIVYHYDLRYSILSMFFRCGIRGGLGHSFNKFFYDRYYLPIQDENQLLSYLNLTKNVIDIIDDGYHKDFDISLNNIEKVETFFLEKKIDLENEIIIGIAPHSAINTKESLALKRWGEENYLKLISKIIEKGIYIILFGNEYDLKFSAHIKNNYENRIIDLIGKCNLEETGAFIKKCNLFVSHDTGLSHLSTTLGIPSIIIFGPTNPNICAPYEAFIENNSDCIIIKKKVDCSPCYSLGKHSNCTNNKCLSLISVDEIYNEIMEMLQKKGFKHI